ncbi:hypothetical protein BDY17DRAFT_257459 [Neohortaea acidophila]|uniref:Armadillo-like helical domain-containing protein n=1 Tax=Neohortaea acidophila TaxID=245834 RepID=A0A6A6PG50_9PEZI|nr:uncharacterized protein BDY17DRAFT_257459 [Neohortaea acidophila]KAF2478968.1 hypothetical protein BDY17DRAFT_257459 [Neohortaea acidophila]
MDRPNAPQPKRLALQPEWRENRLSFVGAVAPLSPAGLPQKATIEQSPLTQDVRPDVFEPKVVGLYRNLFPEIDDDERAEGYWKELFLLRPEITRLREILADTGPDFLLSIQHQSQQLLIHAIAQIRSGEQSGTENALDTLAVFFSVVLAKKYTNPSSDIIEVLAGLDDVDAVFTELVTTLDHCIKDGGSYEIRQKAVRTTLAVVSGAYQTVLVSYFINRDFFPALMKLVNQLQHPPDAAEPLLLAGLLANYNKFEVQNQYSVRFADFVHDEAMKSIIQAISSTSANLRQQYIVIQDDTPIAWSVSGTLSYVGLGKLAGAKPASPVLPEPQQRELLAEQPGLEISTLLTLYDFVLCNKLFSHHFVTTPSLDGSQPPPFSMFVSFNSYLYQHAFRSSRASTYAYLTLLVLLILVEDTTTAKLLSETSAPVRLCRQRPPLLPAINGERTYATAIIDLLTDGINHNLRKKLDSNFYLQSLIVLSRLLTYLAKTRTKFTYHWSELWRSLLSFVRFLTAYEEDVRRLSRATEVVHALMDVLIIALTGGENFLPDAAAYDDLFYKLVESGEVLVKLRDTYSIATGSERSPINTLISVSQHYKEMIESQRSKKQHLSPREVNKIIKQGYETLSFDVKDEADQAAAKYREVQYKTELKRIARVVVADAAAWAAK